MVRHELPLPGPRDRRGHRLRRRPGQTTAGVRRGGRALRDGAAHLPPPLPPAPAAWRHDDVRARLAALGPADRRRGDYPSRAAAQQRRLRLPDLPTTTIGSFPQTAELRTARAEHRAGRLDDAGYDRRMRAEVEHVIRLQERLGLDVLVHGEPERNDMVQYFGEQLDGFAATEHGWVQSYGSRCVRPPIIYGDVARAAPMTVAWSTYAQSLTSRPVKGMLTGPVTILAWSFVRTDQPPADTADQVALALRDECHDLEAAGITVIQVDEPALRELLPLRAADQKAYLDWAVGAFRLATGGVADTTQIHTHLCYSEFGVTVVSSVAPRQAQRSSRSASMASTSQWTMPSKPGRGSVRKVNRCPTTGAKSLGMSHRASRSGSVSARHTRAGECGRYWATSMAVRSAIVVLGVQQVGQAGQAVAPEPFVRRQPVGKLAERFGAQRIPPLAADPALDHQPGVLEQSQVLRQARASHVEVLRQLRHRARPVLAQESEHLSPRGVGDRREDVDVRHARAARAARASCRRGRRTRRIAPRALPGCPRAPALLGR